MSFLRKPDLIELCVNATQQEEADLNLARDAFMGSEAGEGHASSDLAYTPELIAEPVTLESLEINTLEEFQEAASTLAAKLKKAPTAFVRTFLVDLVNKGGKDALSIDDFNMVVNSKYHIPHMYPHAIKRQQVFGAWRKDGILVF